MTTTSYIKNVTIVITTMTDDEKREQIELRKEMRDQVYDPHTIQEINDQIRQIHASIKIQ